MEWFDAHIGSIDAALQETPKVFKAIGMNLPIHIFERVIYNLTGIIRAKSAIGHERIGVEGRASFYMLPHVALDCASLAVRDHGGLDLSAPLQESHYSGLVPSAGSGDAALTLCDVHVAGLATDESLIHFDRATVSAQLRKGTILHSLADSVKHEPGGLLSDTQRPGNLTRANAILRGSDEPHGREPSFESKGRILKYGSHLRGELALCMAGLALPFLLVRQIGHILAATGRAFDAIGPAMRGHVSEAVVSVCEVNDGLLESLWRFHVLRIGEST